MPDSEQHDLRLLEAAGSLAGLRRRIGVAAAARLIGGVFALAVPLALGKLVGALAGNGSAEEFGLWTAAAIGAVALHLLAEFAAASTAATARHRLIARMRLRWFERIVRARMAAFDEARVQDWVTLLGRDISRVAGFVVSLPTSIAYGAAVGIGSIVMMATLSLRLAVAVALLGPLVFAGSRFVAHRVRDVTARYWQREVESMRQAHETLAAISVVKTFAVEDERLEAQSERAEEAARLGATQQRLMNLVGPATQFVAFVGVLGIVFASTRGWVALGVTDLTAFVGYALLLTAPVRSAAGTYSSAMEAYGALERFERADALGAEDYAGDTLDLDSVRLAVEDVEFSYGDTEVFPEAVSLRINQGDSLVLIGENGGGKSTLLALLLRLRTPTAGSVTLNGVDVSTLDLRWYRRLFAVALQETVVIDGTIRENVRFARPDADSDDVEAAAAAALLDEVVASLPDGWDTRVGEQGVRLSGGQRQRLALARAFLCDAPILVFDEATSMFDPEAQRRFVDRNADTFGQKTVVWVTHGEAAQTIADRIIEVKNGRLRAALRSIEERRA